MIKYIITKVLFVVYLPSTLLSDRSLCLFYGDDELDEPDVKGQVQGQRQKGKKDKFVRG